MLEFMAVTPVVASAKRGTSIADAAMKAQAPAGSTGTKFSVDPEQAEQLVKDLEAAVQQLRAIARDVEPLTDLPAPGKDWHSGVAASKIREIAGDNPGGYLKANREAREALQATADNVRKALEKYKATEGNVHQSMR